jgi:hypothetical protein
METESKSDSVAMVQHLQRFGNPTGVERRMIIQPTRRRMLAGAISTLFAAPAIVRVEALMAMPRKRVVNPLTLAEYIRHINESLAPFIDEYVRMHTDAMLYGDGALSATLIGIHYHEFSKIHASPADASPVPAAVQISPQFRRRLNGSGRLV